jgi:hypothetical protein
VFGLDRFKLHRSLVDGTVKSVWFRQVFGSADSKAIKILLILTDIFAPVYPLNLQVKSNRYFSFQFVDITVDIYVQ